VCILVYYYLVRGTLRIIFVCVSLTFCRTRLQRSAVFCYILSFFCSYYDLYGHVDVIIRGYRFLTIATEWACTDYTYKYYIIIATNFRREHTRNNVYIYILSILKIYIALHKTRTTELGVWKIYVPIIMNLSYFIIETDVRTRVNAIYYVIIWPKYSRRGYVILSSRKCSLSCTAAQTFKQFDRPQRVSWLVSFFLWKKNYFIYDRVKPTETYEFVTPISVKFIKPFWNRFKTKKMK